MHDKKIYYKSFQIYVLIKCNLERFSAKKTFFDYYVLGSDKKSMSLGSISDQSNIPEASIFNAKFRPLK